MPEHLNDLVGDNEVDIAVHVVDDIFTRRDFGYGKYGRYIYPNDENYLQYAYEETLDLAQYLKAQIVKESPANKAMLQAGLEELRWAACLASEALTLDGNYREATRLREACASLCALFHI